MYSLILYSHTLQLQSCWCRYFSLILIDIALVLHSLWAFSAWCPRMKQHLLSSGTGWNTFNVKCNLWVLISTWKPEITCKSCTEHKKCSQLGMHDLLSSSFGHTFTALTLICCVSDGNQWIITLSWSLCCCDVTLFSSDIWDQINRYISFISQNHWDLILIGWTIYPYHKDNVIKS